MRPMSSADPGRGRRSGSASRPGENGHEAEIRPDARPQKEGGASELRGGGSAPSDDAGRRDLGRGENGQRERFQDERSSRRAKAVAVAVIASSLLALSVALLVVPGPAAIVIPLGLAILATEFVWSRKIYSTMGRSLQRRKLRRQRARQRRSPRGPRLP